MLFRKKKVMRKVWGILVEPQLQTFYKLIAEACRVPISVLAGHVLRVWLVENAETMLTNKRKRIEFGEYLVRTYLKKRKS
ncbi:hypothetical protein ACFLVI_03435 [Chloroflexota bacterium]